MHKNQYNFQIFFLIKFAISRYSKPQKSIKRDCLNPKNYEDLKKKNFQNKVLQWETEGTIFICFSFSSKVKMKRRMLHKE